MDIWNSRNNHIFQGNQHNPSKVFILAQIHIEEYVQAYVKVNEMIVRLSLGIGGFMNSEIFFPMLVFGVPSLCHIVKISFNASWSENAVCLGYLIRDYQGVVFYGR